MPAAAALRGSEGESAAESGEACLAAAVLHQPAGQPDSQSRVRKPAATTRLLSAGKQDPHAGELHGTATAGGLPEREPALDARSM